MFHVKHNRKLFIVGFSCSGKSTLACLLSAKTGLSHEDLDQNIEGEMGRSINNIFATEGEDAFRQMESRALRNAKAQIVSTGGGIVCRKENIAYMKSVGVILLLSTPARLLVERLKFSNDRPLSSQKEESEIKKLLYSRAAFYSEADICIDTAERSPKEVAHIVMEEYL